MLRTHTTLGLILMLLAGCATAPPTRLLHGKHSAAVDLLTENLRRRVRINTNRGILEIGSFGRDVLQEDKR
jgi:hypothetical protein